MSEEWVISFTPDGHGLIAEMAPLSARCAMPMVFPCREGAEVCIAAIERIIGRMVLKGVPNFDGLLAGMEMRRS